MRIESKLCHLSENKAVVQVSGWLNEKILGSALAEGPTVEVAEDKAISRLNNRLNGLINNDDRAKTIHTNKIQSTLKPELPSSENIERVTLKKEPIDWSNELTEIDSVIKRLKWSREDEISFLEKNLGYNNRNKITNYNDIIEYLSLLKKIEKKEKINKNINTLIEESESILRDLSWDHVQGREYLQKEFNVSTRMELSEKQLISFNEKLKSIQKKNQPD